MELAQICKRGILPLSILKPFIEPWTNYNVSPRLISHSLNIPPPPHLSLLFSVRLSFSVFLSLSPRLLSISQSPWHMQHLKDPLSLSLSLMLKEYHHVYTYIRLTTPGLPSYTNSVRLHYITALQRPPPRLYEFVNTQWAQSCSEYTNIKNLIFLSSIQPSIQHKPCASTSRVHRWSHLVAGRFISNFKMMDAHSTHKGFTMMCIGFSICENCYIWLQLMNEVYLHPKNTLISFQWLAT